MTGIRTYGLLAFRATPRVTHSRFSRDVMSGTKRSWQTQNFTHKEHGRSCPSNNSQINSIPSILSESLMKLERWIERITFVAEINVASSRSSADIQTHRHTKVEHHNTFSVR